MVTSCECLSCGNEAAWRLRGSISMAATMEMRRNSGWEGLEASRIVGWEFAGGGTKQVVMAELRLLQCYDDDVMAVGPCNLSGGRAP